MFEEGNNRYGKITVTWAKWNTYQEDTTAKKRMRSLRHKRRGEEKREKKEKKRGEEKKLAPPKPAQTQLKILTKNLANKMGLESNQTSEQFQKRKDELARQARIIEEEDQNANIGT